MNLFITFREMPKRRKKELVKRPSNVKRRPSRLLPLSQPMTMSSLKIEEIFDSSLNSTFLL
jgi:hypothetical protein